MQHARSLEKYLNQESSVFNGVGSNPCKTFFFFFFFFFLFRLFSQLVFNVSCICKETFFLLFPSCSMLYMISRRLCLFIVFNLDLFVNREYSLTS